MAFAKTLTKFLTSNPISSIGNVLTIITSVYSIATEIYAHITGDGTFNDVEDPVLTGVEKLQEEVAAVREDIANLESALTNLILSEFSGLQQQLLASAQSRAESALDLLASYQIDPDIDRGEIIADVSRALRDTLAQARQMLEPSSPPTALNALKAAMGAVGYTLYARLEVARELEGDEIASDKIARQIDDAMTFFEDVVTYIEGRISPKTISYDGPSRTFTVYLDKAPFPEFYNVGFSQTAEATSLGYRGTPFSFSPWITNRAADFAGPYKVNMLNNLDVYYIPSIDKVINLFAFPEEYYDLAGNLVTRDHPEARSANEVWFAECKAWVIEQTLQWFNIDRPTLTATIAGFRDLTDGKQLILPSIPGFENDGTLTGTDGNDLIIGNDGDDFLYGMGDPDIVRGKEGNDRIWGGDGGDRLEGNEGDDWLYGEAGDDALLGGTGNDMIDGGDGRDLAVFAGRRSDYNVTWTREGGQLRVIVEGPDGRDELVNVERLVFDNRMVQFQTGGNDVPLLGDILFSSGTRRIAEDVMFGLGSGGTLDGGMGDDTLVSGGGVSRLIGGTGNDRIMGAPGIAFLYHDTAVFSGARAGYVLEVSLGQVIVTGPDGRDTLTDIDYLEFGDMTIAWRRSSFIPSFNAWVASGGSGEDIVTGNDRDEFLSGGAGDDVVLGEAGNDRIDGDSRFAVGDGADWLDGGAGNDTVNGGGGDDRMFGGAGNDILQGGAGADALDGGEGLDRADYSDAAEGVAADLQNAAANTGFAAGDTYVSIENLYGSRFGDTLRGDSGANVIWGNSGADQLYGRGGNDNLQGMNGGDALYGGEGNDTLSGGRGTDVLNGGAGADTFVFRKNFGDDRIVRFENNVDKIRLDDAIWGGGLTAEQVIATYGSVVAGSSVLDFGNGNVITIANFRNISELTDDLVIV